MNIREKLKKIKIFCLLLRYFTFPICILSKYPNSLIKNEVCFENNKISINLSKIGRYYKKADDKFYNAIGKLLKAGLLELEECSDKNFHKLSYTKGNFQKYLNSYKIGQKREKIVELLHEHIYGTKK